MSNKDIFEITGIKLVGSYIFDLPKNEECTICRNSLHTASIYNQEKGLDSYVVSGTCGHSYHNECIKSWIEKNKYCPICFEKWESTKNNNELENTNKIDKSDYYKNLIDNYKNKKNIDYKDAMNDDKDDKMINDYKDAMINDYKDKYIKLSDDYKDKKASDDYDDMPSLVSEQEIKKIHQNKILKTINIISSSIDHDLKYNIITSAQHLIKEIATDFVKKDLDDEIIMSNKKSDFKKNIIIKHVFSDEGDISDNKDVKKPKH